MPQLSVKVKKLNKRSKIPTDLSDKTSVVDTVPFGHTFNGTLVTGPNLPKPPLDKWYKDDEGFFYWGEGFHIIDSPAKFDSPVKHIFDPSKMSWAHDSVVNGGLGIVDLWNEMGVRGEGIKVAVIDTGAIFKSNDLNGAINEKLSIDCVGFADIQDTDAPEFHGTRSAGVIAANGKSVHKVYGVAPNCELIIYRLFSNGNLQGYTDQNFCFVLQEARKANVDIISMSFEMPVKPAGIDAEIKACLDQNILLVAAAGDEPQNLGIKNNFPASLPGCISVGAYRLLNKVRTPYIEHSSKSNFLFCLAPGEDVLTTGSTGTPVFHQFTSAAAPFVAGIFASILSYRKKKNLPISVTDITEKLKKCCDKIDRTKPKDEIEGFGVINPMALFNLLKK